jgi:hypothetical protein
MYSFLADAVLVLHLLFVLFVGLGGLLVLRWHWLAWLHVPAALWGAFIEFSGGICPLTPLENLLRERAARTTYEGGFIEHYVSAWIYPDGLSREMQLTIGAAVLMINAAVYAWILHRWRRNK